MRVLNESGTLDYSEGRFGSFLRRSIDALPADAKTASAT
jgi:hypothetical protein